MFPIITRTCLPRLTFATDAGRCHTINYCSDKPMARRWFGKKGNNYAYYGGTNYSRQLLRPRRSLLYLIFILPHAMANPGSATVHIPRLAKESISL